MDDSMEQINLGQEGLRHVSKSPNKTDYPKIVNDLPQDRSPLLGESSSSNMIKPGNEIYGIKEGDPTDDDEDDDEDDELNCNPLEGQYGSTLDYLMLGNCSEELGKSYNNFEDPMSSSESKSSISDLDVTLNRFPYPTIPDPFYLQSSDLAVFENWERKKRKELELDYLRQIIRDTHEASGTTQGIYKVKPKFSVYDPSEYSHLVVATEIKDLFQYIVRYTPQTVELDHKLKPFIPDYIPAVGDIDAFIKIPRPDGKADSLGLSVLDEPSAKQSDPTVLDLQLRALSKQTSAKAVSIKKIENADKHSKAIERWIKDISELHRSKPPPTVHYSKPMPDIDSLMQDWPTKFEALLRSACLPSANLDCDLGTYVDIVCATLDIPVYKSKIQSLHLLFTMFLAFKNSKNLSSE